MPAGWLTPAAGAETAATPAFLSVLQPAAAAVFAAPDAATLSTATQPATSLSPSAFSPTTLAAALSPAAHAAALATATQPPAPSTAASLASATLAAGRW